MPFAGFSGSEFLAPLESIAAKPKAEMLAEHNAAEARRGAGPSKVFIASYTEVYIMRFVSVRVCVGSVLAHGGFTQRFMTFGFI